MFLFGTVVSCPPNKEEKMSTTTAPVKTPVKSPDKTPSSDPFKSPKPTVMPEPKN